MNDSTLDTMTHIARVQALLADVCALLTERARVHDDSKLHEPEKSGFDALLGRLANAQYGTDDYRAALAEGKPTIEHHYAANTHHPEHWPNGINDMSLLDVIEMFVDWRAAGERTKAGSMAQSLAVNKERFGISDQLAAIFENTRKELNW